MGNAILILLLGTVVGRVLHLRRTGERPGLLQEALDFLGQFLFSGLIFVFLLLLFAALG